MVPDVYAASQSRYDEMMFRRCGHSGVLLPEISLGMWHNFGSVDPLQRSIEIVHYAFDHGITHFDLANNYGPVYGSAEETMGLIMKKSLQPYRDELFISSKAGYDMWPGPYGNFGSRKYLMASLDQSLKRMNLEYVDLFYSHRFDPDTPMEETLQALVDIVRRGKALYVGISQWPYEATKFAIEYLRERDVPLLIYQGRLSIFDQVHKQSGLLDLLEKEKVGFISFSPLAQGLLTNRYLNGIPEDSRIARGGHLKESALTPEAMEKIRALNVIAESRGCTLAELALKWVLQQKAVSSVIVGVSSVSQLANNLKVMNIPSLTPQELQAIDQIVS